MKQELITSDVWPRITAEAKKAAKRSHVAVAYFGTGASRMLPLRKGSTLIVDMSLGAVTAGQTRPSEVLTLINHGVEVHSVENLHAKVFVLGNRTLVGSSNVSGNSARNLIEAAVSSDNRKLASACRSFVKGLRGEMVTRDQAEKLQSLWRPPRFEWAGRRSGQTGHEPKHETLWAVPLVKRGWDNDDKKAEKAGEPLAKRRLSSKPDSSLQRFSWTGAAFLKRLKNNHLVVEVTDYGNRRFMVSPASRVLSIERFKVGAQFRAIVFLASPAAARRKNLKVVVKSLGPSAKTLKDLSGPTVIRDRAFAHALLHLWPTAG